MLSDGAIRLWQRIAETRRPSAAAALEAEVDEGIFAVVLYEFGTVLVSTFKHLGSVGHHPRDCSG